VPSSLRASMAESAITGTCLERFCCHALRRPGSAVTLSSPVVEEVDHADAQRCRERTEAACDQLDEILRQRMQKCHVAPSPLGVPTRTGVYSVPVVSVTRRRAFMSVPASARPPVSAPGPASPDAARPNGETE